MIVRDATATHGRTTAPSLIKSFGQRSRTAATAESFRPMLGRVVSDFSAPAPTLMAKNMNAWPSVAGSAKQPEGSGVAELHTGPMDYLSVRTVHIATACTSFALFTARGAMQLGGIDWRRWRWLRIAPHLNDTLLLAAAITLAVMSGQYPLAQGWLTAKVVALFV